MASSTAGMSVALLHQAGAVTAWRWWKRRCGVGAPSGRSRISGLLVLVILSESQIDCMSSHCRRGLPIEPALTCRTSSMAQRWPEVASANIEAGTIWSPYQRFRREAGRMPKAVQWRWRRGARQKVLQIVPPPAT